MQNDEINIHFQLHTLPHSSKKTILLVTNYTVKKLVYYVKWVSEILEGRTNRAGHLLLSNCKIMNGEVQVLLYTRYRFYAIISCKRE
jgi:hypothetical protein